jgi:hypothetical protein
MNFSRELDRFTRMAVFAVLSTSGVWGVWAWSAGEPDPLFRVIELNSHPAVRAALVDVPEPPRYRNAVQVERVERLVEPPHVDAPRPHVMPRYAQVPNFTYERQRRDDRHDDPAMCRSCVSPYCLRLYHGER